LSWVVAFEAIERVVRRFNGATASKKSNPSVEKDTAWKAASSGSDDWMTEGASTNWVKPRLKVPRPARSVDRTRSPAAVSQKREYFGIWPETFGNFAPPLAKSGGWRPLAESEKPAVGGISPTIRDGFPEGRTAWLTWEDLNFNTTFHERL
jgi:hypothetical protein